MLKKNDIADLTSKVAKQRKLQSNGHLTNLQKHAASTGVYLEIVRVGQTFFFWKIDCRLWTFFRLSPIFMHPPHRYTAGRCGVAEGVSSRPVSHT